MVQAKIKLEKAEKRLCVSIQYIQCAKHLPAQLHDFNLHKLWIPDGISQTQQVHEIRPEQRHGQSLEGSDNGQHQVCERDLDLNQRLQQSTHEKQQRPKVAPTTGLTQSNISGNEYSQQHAVTKKDVANNVSICSIIMIPG